jgi:hypothetical protein
MASSARLRSTNCPTWLPRLSRVASSSSSGSCGLLSRNSIAPTTPRAVRIGKHSPAWMPASTRCLGAREVRVGLHLADPGGLAGRPDAAGQTVAGRERQAAAEAREPGQVRVRTPRRDAAHERRRAGFFLPHRAELPAQRRRDRLEQLRVRLGDGDCRGEDQRDFVLEREDLLSCSPPSVFPGLPFHGLVLIVAQCARSERARRPSKTNSGIHGSEGGNGT